MRLVSILLILVFACTPRQNQRSQQVLTFEDVEIPKEGTAIIGMIDKVTDEDEITLTLIVKSIKQGGAGTPVFGKDSSESFLVTKAYQRKYEADNDRILLQDLDAGNEILLIVREDPGSQQLIISKILLP